MEFQEDLIFDQIEILNQSSYFTSRTHSNHEKHQLIEEISKSQLTLKFKKSDILHKKNFYVSLDHKFKYFYIILKGQVGEYVKVDQGQNNHRISDKQENQIHFRSHSSLDGNKSPSNRSENGGYQSSFIEKLEDQSQCEQDIGLPVQEPSKGIDKMKLVWVHRQGDTPGGYEKMDESIPKRSFICMQDTLILACDQDMFETELRQREEKYYLKYKHLLFENYIPHLNNSNINQLFFGNIRSLYKQNQIIISQEDQVSNVYFVLEGEIQLRKQIYYYEFVDINDLHQQPFLESEIKVSPDLRKKQKTFKQKAVIYQKIINLIKNKICNFQIEVLTQNECFGDSELINQSSTSFYTCVVKSDNCQILIVPYQKFNELFDISVFRHFFQNFHGQKHHFREQLAQTVHKTEKDYKQLLNFQKKMTMLRKNSLDYLIRENLPLNRSDFVRLKFDLENIQNNVSPQNLSVHSSTSSFLNLHNQNFKQIYQIENFRSALNNNREIQQTSVDANKRSQNLLKSNEFEFLDDLNSQSIFKQEAQNQPTITTFKNHMGKIIPMLISTSPRETSNLFNQSKSTKADLLSPTSVNSKHINSFQFNIEPNQHISNIIERQNDSTLDERAFKEHLVVNQPKQWVKSPKKEFFISQEKEFTDEITNFCRNKQLDLPMVNPREKYPKLFEIERKENPRASLEKLTVGFKLNIYDQVLQNQLIIQQSIFDQKVQKMSNIHAETERRRQQKKRDDILQYQQRVKPMANHDLAYIQLKRINKNRGSNQIQYKPE